MVDYPQQPEVDVLSSNKVKQLLKLLYSKLQLLGLLKGFYLETIDGEIEEKLQENLYEILECCHLAICGIEMEVFKFPRFRRVQHNDILLLFLSLPRVRFPNDQEITDPDLRNLYPKVISLIQSLTDNNCFSSVKEDINMEQALQYYYDHDDILPEDQILEPYLSNFLTVYNKDFNVYRNAQLIFYKKVMDRLVKEAEEDEEETRRADLEWERECEEERKTRKSKE
jgi:hypothetical protein